MIYYDIHENKAKWLALLPHSQDNDVRISICMLLSITKFGYVWDNELW